jgi:hypothetical protein
MDEPTPNQTEPEAARRQAEQAAWLNDLAAADEAAPRGGAMARQERAVAMELEMEAEYLRAHAAAAAGRPSGAAVDPAQHR